MHACVCVLQAAQLGLRAQQVEALQAELSTARSHLADRSELGMVRSADMQAMHTDLNDALR